MNMSLFMDMDMDMDMLMMMIIMMNMKVTDSSLVSVKCLEKKKNLYFIVIQNLLFK